MASAAHDLHGHRRPSSKRKSPFQGERTAGASSPYRFPKIEPLPNVADVSYDGEDLDPAHGSIIQVEEELERLVETVRTLGSDSGNHAELGLDEYEDEEEEKKTYSLKARETDIRSRRRRSSLMEKGSNHDQVSSLLVEPGRKLHEPLRTTIIRILCWKLLLSTILSLPCLLIADFIPFLNIVTIPITSIFGVVLFFDFAFIAYLMLAQTDPPDAVTLPFLPWDPKLVWKVNRVLFQWLLVALRVAPKLMRDWAIRRILKSKRKAVASTVPGKRLDVYRATPPPNLANLAHRQSSPSPPTPSSPIAARKSESSTILPAPGIGGTVGDLVLSRNMGREVNGLAPVIVFFHSPQLGPIKGKKWMYETLGRNLADMGYTVVIPDLTSYPEGKAKQMVQDSGRPPCTLQEAIVLSRDKILDPGVEMANGLRELKIYDRTVRLPPIQGLILLAPICNVNDQVIGESMRGVSHLSKLRRILGPNHTRAMFHSPVHVLHAARNVIDPNLLPPKILFIHGGLDEEVSYLQSVLMKEIMTGVGLPDVYFKIYPVGHVDVVTAMMMNQDEPCSSSILEDREYTTASSIPTNH
ncbi:hypothetical protein FS837_002831 [Tulasnella sp. UAMH 9824]|nr:hypothetical protein FS837_002831 [Tulasnella sp. UAMH 9824]